jgi:hypothetical protein
MAVASSEETISKKALASKNVEVALLRVLTT